MTTSCNAPAESRRRIFWSTQLCRRSQDECGRVCYLPGIELFCTVEGDCTDKSLPKRISNENWLRGLVYNILFTRGRNPDNPCTPYSSDLGGHWSDSFRKGPSSGSSYVYKKNYASVSDAQADLLVRLRTDMSKLIQYGVAESVDVKVTYAGGNQFDVIVIIFTKDGDSLEIGLIATKTSGIVAY